MSSTADASNLGPINVQKINHLIQQLPSDYPGLVSDGNHTIDELYDHRITLFLALARHQARGRGATNIRPVWRIATSFDWFLLGIGKKSGDQITYHLPQYRWKECGFAETLDIAPEWDGHTSADVLERLKQL